MREGLLALLKASNKKIVDDIFVQEFPFRRESNINKERINFAVSALGINEDEGKLLIKDVRELTRDALMDNAVNESALQLFPDDFHAGLKKLIALILTHHMVEWRREAIANQISLPKLEKIDWRVDVKSASDQMSAMSVPTILMQLQVRDDHNEESPLQRINFELSQQTLNTVIDGFGKIKDQLASLRPSQS